MNTIIIHRSIPRLRSSRDKNREALQREAMDILLMPLWSSGVKPTPWWVEQGKSSQKLEMVLEEVVDTVAVVDVDDDTTDVEDDDVTVVDPKEDTNIRGEFLLDEINADEQFKWAKRMSSEEDKNDDDWVIDTYAKGWHSTVYEEDDRSVYSQESFDEDKPEEETPQPPARLTGGTLAKVYKFMKKASHMARGRRTRRFAM